ncbi:hypothetical protein J2S36_000115 [Arcanobacterium hippocoleae]|uniref:Uncharacterized protein n=2 Tax=Arcanobacterium hippocoleae TaxID=149017 RepID=A0ABU1SZL7_9ACTO|nr:hypothetical protein [Arcanobacterium hippocoleae]
MDPNTLAVLTGNAEKTQTPVVKSNFYFYWSSPKLSNRCNYLIRKNTPQIIKPLEYPALFWYMPSIWSAIYRRDFLVKHEIRFLETPGASYQDVSFTFKVWACAEKVSLLPNAFVHYRQDNENSSIHSAGKVFAVAKEFAEIERFIAGFGPATPKHKKLKTYETRLKWDSYIWNYWRLTPAGRKDFFPHFQHTFKAEFSAGNINPQYFFPWSKKDLNLLLKHPKTFQNRTADQYSGKTRHFWKLLACITENRISPQKWAQTRKQVCGNWQQ